MLSHLLDYTCWFNGYSAGQWAMAQAAGTFNIRQSSFTGLYRGIRSVRERRPLHIVRRQHPDQPEVGKWWGKNRMGAQAPKGLLKF